MSGRFEPHLGQNFIITIIIIISLSQYIAGHKALQLHNILCIPQIVVFRLGAPCGRFMYD